MKKIIFIVISFVLTFNFYSCKKDTPLSASYPIKSLKDVSVKNGRLHFPSQKALQETRIALNQKEKIDLTEWYKGIGFKSMSQLYFKVNEEYSKVNTKEQYNSFIDKHKDYIYITPKKSISVQGFYPFLAQVLNINGEVSVGKSLVKYTNKYKITIIDGDENKLEEALRTLSNNEKKGIFIQKINFIQMPNARYCTATSVGHDCYHGTHERIWGRYNLFSELSGLDAFAINEDQPLEYGSRLEAYIKSEYKGFLGFWYLKWTDITWSIGWGASTTNQTPDIQPIQHGTGWTAYNHSSISYSFPIVSHTAGVYLRPSQLSSYVYNFDYCYANLSTPNISCSEGCN